jgi:glucokinase
MSLGCYHFLLPAHIKNVACVSVGTGIASGFFINGNLIRGAHGLSGEIGHMVVGSSPRPCRCGNNGCLESLAAGPAIARMGREAVQQGRSTRLREMREITAQAIFELAQTGDLVSQEIVAQVGKYMGRALYNIVMTLDLEHIIIGGGVALAGEVLLDAILTDWERYRAGSELSRQMLHPEMITLVPPDFMAGAWGAIILARDGLAAQPAASRSDERIKEMPSL